MNIEVRSQITTANHQKSGNNLPTVAQRFIHTLFHMSFQPKSYHSKALHDST
jgi:hypothetical protein